MNKVMLLGRLSKDPELRVTPSGVSVCNFTVAVNRQFKKDEADFINCQAWRQSAEFVANYFKKGDMIALEGAIQVRSYDDKEGNKRWVTEVVVDHAEFTGSKKEATVPVEQMGEEITFDDNELPF